MFVVLWSSSDRKIALPGVFASSSSNIFLSAEMSAWVTKSAVEDLVLTSRVPFFYNFCCL